MRSRIEARIKNCHIWERVEANKGRRVSCYLQEQRHGPRKAKKYQNKQKTTEKRTRQSHSHTRSNARVCHVIAYTGCTTSDRILPHRNERRGSLSFYCVSRLSASHLSNYWYDRLVFVRYCLSERPLGGKGEVL